MIKPLTALPVSVEGKIENRGEFLHLRACAATDIGKRANNEDTFLMNEKLGLFMVADGMGGCDVGEFASWFATRKVEEIMVLMHKDEQTVGPDDSFHGSRIFDEAHLQYAMWVANVNLKTEAVKRGFAKSGTTLAAVFFKGNRVYVANIGDSRCYRVSCGEINKVTHDHSVVARRLRMGEITKRGFKRAKGHNLITRTIGLDDPAQADSYILTVYPRERFLLCTDGFYNMVDEKTVLKYVEEFGIKQACEELVTFARDSGGRDNITAVLVEVVSVGSSPSSTVLSDHKKIQVPDEETIT